ncbi:MAG: DNA helicase UvrD [Verrucomicrobiales bacterium]|nr:DNA helicase UvrD [Verrucomicrobiales bacterium]
MARDYTIHRVPKNAKSEIDYAKELNEKQLAAVTAPPGPSLVIAGAGSGKTRTLTYRVAYLLDNGIAAKNILLLTFTNKAAREMLDRVEELVPYDTSELWGGTFHSIGNRILRRHANLLGWERNFSIMDREDQKEILKAVIGESDIDTKAMRFPKPEVLADIFSLAKNTGTEIEEILHTRYPYFEHLSSSIVKLEEGYEEKKKATNSMDFDDLLEKTLLLFEENRGVRESYQHQFEWVLVDEYQDTNELQAELIDILGEPQRNVMVVGDDAQSIYSWRGADFRNILDFPEKYEGAAKYVIETNYRSVPEILSLANAAIAPNTKQFRKDLAPWRPDREELPALAPLQDPNTQAAFVAQRILELRDEGIELDEIAVLYRAHYHAMEIQMELTNRGIPFVITSGLRFFEQAHIKDVAAFMKFVCNRRDEVAFKRIAKMLPGIGAKSADNLWLAWLQCEGSRSEIVHSFSEYMLEFKTPSKAKASWDQLAYTLDELVDGDGRPKAPAPMMPSIMGGVYEDYMRSKFSNFDNRRQDLLQLERYAERFDDLEEFLSQLSLLAGQDAVGATQQEQDKESVCLSSVHQAKGLEWRAVFVVWLADGMFPNNRVIDEDDEDQSGLEEERRLFYVAVTRAKDELYLTYPLIWHGGFNGDVIQQPSRFLQDIPTEMVEEWNVGAAW